MKFSDLLPWRQSKTERRNFLNYALSQVDNTVSVTPETALTFSAVYAAVRVISETISQLPLCYYKKTETGREKYTESPLYSLLHDEPNNIQTKYVFFETFLNTLLLYGNAYAHISRDKRGRAIALHLIHPDDVNIFVIDNALVYEIKDRGRFDASNIIHVPDMTKDGIVGISRIQYAKNNIALGLAAQDYGKNLAESGGRISGVLEHPGQLGADAMQNLRDHWQRTYHTGQKTSFKTAVLEEGMSYKPIQLRPDEMAYLATRKFSILEISRIFRVSPHLLGDLERATFSNIEHQSQEFITHTINPIATKLEQEFNKKLIFENEKGYTYFEFNRTALLRADAKARSEYYAKLFSVGAISPNEIRQRENMNDSENGYNYYVPMNFVTTDKNTNNETGKGNATV